MAWAQRDCAKGDGETPTENISEHVAEHGAGGGTRTAKETTPVGDSRSIGFIKNAHKSMEAPTKTLLIALSPSLSLSHNIGCRVGVDWGVFQRIAIQSDTLLNRYHAQPSNDGKTAHGIAHGRNSKR